MFCDRPRKFSLNQINYYPDMLFSGLQDADVGGESENLEFFEHPAVRRVSQKTCSLSKCFYLGFAK